MVSEVKGRVLIEFGREGPRSLRENVRPIEDGKTKDHIMIGVQGASVNGELLA